ncbi:DUF397 domain-containing protein [Kineosporia rhizophila]|uniref:DUF397 domain-containing protein n=1 Tax=Kineosporia rhizophila TaxID=84633 RepID=UPI000AB3EA72|nr:DUF397 domain-containing protein [Kineosporia rhizophila]MCE0537763.1 DUF397 domain-containing protein [Kineosporia rhizophila]
MSTDGITWLKATKSADSGNCVELGVEAGQASVVYLRDSKNKQGPVLALGRSGLAAFVQGAKLGEYDDLGR